MADLPKTSGEKAERCTRRHYVILTHRRWQGIDVATPPSSNVPSGLLLPSSPGFGRPCPNETWFLSLTDAKEKIEEWCRYYNEDRGSMAALRNLAPYGFHPVGS